MSHKKVVIHTDGACEGNPGPGGWAAVLRHGALAKELSGAEPATTNNRMEVSLNRPPASPSRNDAVGLTEESAG